MFSGYFDLGGREIGNAARAVAYVRQLAPAMGVLDPLRSDTMLPIVTEAPYTTPEGDSAPWYDRDDPDTANFYGVYPLEMTNLDSSTRQADVTEGIADGGFVGLPRQATREVLIRAALYGRDEMAINAGLTWLREALAIEQKNCSVHGSTCGSQDFSFFAARPEADLDGAEGNLRFRRYLHSVAQTAPVVVQESREVGSKEGPCGFYAVVEFAVTAENPEIFRYPVVTRLSTPVGPMLVEQAETEVVNRAIHPSFSDFTTKTTIRRNLVTQPSGESSTDLWQIYSSAGSTVDGTISTQDPALGAPLGRGFIRLQFNAASGGPTRTVGLRHSVPVTAGQRYSFRVVTVRATVTQRMRMFIEWRTDTDLISTSNGPTWIGEANQDRENLTVQNALAPANATRAWIVVASTPGSFATTWPTGSRLLVDGVIAVEGQYAPPYFDGDSRGSGDVEYAWAGARQNSTSIMRAPMPLGMIPSESAFGGGVGAAFRTRQFGLFGDSCGVYQWRDDQAQALPSFFGMGGDLAALASVAPGLEYVGSLHVSSTRAIPIVAQLVWFNGAGDEIGAESLPEQVIGASPLWYRFALSGVAPATATFAAARVRVQTSNLVNSGPYARFKANDAVFVDGAMVTAGPNLYSYFDGSTAPSRLFRYQWDGQPDSSTSRRVAFDPTVDDLVDPLLPPIMEPPVPPPIPDIALPADTEWNRIATFIPDEAAFRWAQVYPIVRVSSGLSVARRVRVGLSPDPFAGTGDPRYITQLEQGFVISYLPANAVLTFDASIRKAWVQIGGGPPRDASSLVFGLDGGPVQWPSLSGGPGYVLTVDTPVGAGLAGPVELLAVRKE